MATEKVSTKPIIKSTIISCSRRTDIPAFLMDWVLENIKKGYVDVVNPFNKSQISRISLCSEDVACWAWWSKNFKPWIKAYEKNKTLFDSYSGHYFQFTINSPSEMESGVKISLEERFQQLEYLLKTFGPLSINVRFDPIVIYKKKGQDKIISNLNKFEYIIENISTIGVKELIFSFATLYPKVIRRMKARGKIIINPSAKDKQKIVEKLKTFCKPYDIQLKTCCQPDLLNIPGIEQAHCIDANKIESLTGIKISKVRDAGQREECGCYKSRDIGGYDGIFRCQHNCDYCYASPARK